MFTIQVEGIDAVTERIDDMVHDVADLHNEVPEQFLEWQTDDMNRKYPNMEESGEWWIRTWTTRIWPRSRLSDKRTPEQKRRRGRRVLFTPIASTGDSSRPILRPELFEALRERMRVVLDKVTWKQK